jgi:LPXTG-motif cell wall-anchored protein
VPDRKTLLLSLVATATLLVPLSASAASQQQAAQAASAPTTSGTSTTPTATTPTFTTPPATSTTPTTPTATTPTFTTPPATTTTPRPPATTTTSTIAPQATVTTPQPAANRKLAHTGKVTAHLAAATSDTIVDFSFSPATVTVNVGDTVTWTNSGHQPHNVVASNGSFTTATLQHGQSASHTFTTAGTFAYICAIHPFMHGTVIVKAAATTTTTPAASNSSSGSGSGSGSQTNPGTSTTGTTSAGSALPITGFDVIASTIAGLALLALGLAIRRRISAD